MEKRIDEQRRVYFFITLFCWYLFLFYICNKFFSRILISCDFNKDITEDFFLPVVVWIKWNFERKDTHLHSSCLKEGKQDECGLLESMMPQRCVSC